MRRWASGVTVVTVRHEARVRAILVTSFLSVSVNPPMVLVSIRREGDTHRLLEAGRVFAVNVLHEGQEELARQLGYSGEETVRSMQTIPYHSAVTGAPILDECLAYLDCRVVDSHEATDHTLYIGLVEDGHERHGYPLLHWERAFRRLDVERDPAC
jgi:flavin reductase (DIM6/NTAB) family NADH-FMN oxidoreductase RutF